MCKSKNIMIINKLADCSIPFHSVLNRQIHSIFDKRCLRFLFILLISLHNAAIIRAQIPENNIYLEHKIINLQNRHINVGASYIFALDDSISAYGHSRIGVDVVVGYKNSSISHYYNYNDQSQLLVSPYCHYKFSDKITFAFRTNMENIKEDLVESNKPYWSDNFRNFRGGIEVAKITYKSQKFEMKFGRDYFMPGLYFNENLLFSKYNYSYDQIKFVFRNRIFELSSYYLNLNSIAIQDTIYQRHLNGHRLSINLFSSGYIAINEIMLYGGQNRQLKPALFNPLLFYYPYQKNMHNFGSNSIISMELFFQYKNIYSYTELMLDDYQADHEVPSDLEPNEYGYNITVGIKNIVPNLNWSINHTKVSNRTYNVEVDVYEKYIYKNYPIGHFLGNNFWEISTTLCYSRQEKFLSELRLSYMEYGAEALYRDFNTDYLNYSVEEGYAENFPFGSIKTHAGGTLNVFYSFSKNITINGRLSYWFENSMLKEKFNCGLNLVVHY